MRTCTRCNEAKPEDAFEMNAGRLRRICRGCRRKQASIRNAAQTAAKRAATLADCRGCGKTHPLDEYLPAGVGRPRSECQACLAKRAARRAAERDRRAGIVETEKRCSRCELVKPAADFGLRTEGRLKSHCRRCIALSQRAVKYGITVEQYEEMETAQAGLCKICEKVPADSLRVDHDHACCPGNSSCGKCVRGLLCHDCNAGIGLLGDDRERIMRAAIYLTSNIDLLREGN